MSIRSILEQAQPAEWAAGLEWYPLAHEQALRLGRAAGVRLDQAAYVIACLSPRTSWAENLRAAWALARHFKAGKRLDEPLGETLRSTWVNLAKAWKILETGNLDAIGQGPKTRAFADNILYPKSSRLVTVDSWAYRIWAGMVGQSDEVPVTIRGKVYEQVAQAYIDVSQDWGLLPLECQAITWVTAHRIDGKP